MSIGTLYTWKTQHKGHIIKATAAYGGVTLDVDPNYVHHETNKTEEFQAKFPHAQIPGLETKNGFKLFEGYAIARYIAGLAPNSGLLGHTPEETALVDQWSHLVESEVDVFTDAVRVMCGGVVPYTKISHTWQLGKQAHALDTLNKHLASRTFFVGERITLADLYVAGLVQKASQYTIDAETRTKYPHLIRHTDTIINHPKLKDSYGPANYIEKAITFTPPPKEKKEPKPAPPAAPKAEKKKKEVAADDDEDDNLVPEEPKVKNPLDDLPKSTFNLEEWKREYSNKDTRGAGGSLEWFYQNFDKDGFSVWRVDFKYNNELTQTYMSSNQIGGFFNRMEASRKYLFGSVGVLGSNNDSVISGALILRGQEADKVVQVAPDWESYEYKKLDLGNADDKAYFEAALAWDLEVDGKKWADGKNFK